MALYAVMWEGLDFRYGYERLGSSYGPNTQTSYLSLPMATLQILVRGRSYRSSPQRVSSYEYYQRRNRTIANRVEVLCFYLAEPQGTKVQYKRRKQTGRDEVLQTVDLLSLIVSGWKAISIAIILSCAKMALNVHTVFKIAARVWVMNTIYIMLIFALVQYTVRGREHPQRQLFRTCGQRYRQSDSRVCPYCDMEFDRRTHQLRHIRLAKRDRNPNLCT
jgi:hypothetical protein